MRGTCVLMLVLLVAGPAPCQAQTTIARGTVVDDAGRPVRDTAVSLVDPLGAVVRSSVTDADGRFVFTNLPPGRFIVRTSTAGGAPVHLPLTIDAALPLEVTVRLPPALAEVVQVDARPATPSTVVSIGGATLATVPARIRGRALQDALATLPGWSTEDNGLLHTRGVDDGVLFVIDGVPVYERLDALNGIAPDVSGMATLNVLTGYVPPEFGYKSGGIVELRSADGAPDWTAGADVAVSSFATVDGGAVAGGPLTPTIDARLGGSVQRSDRFLDPVHPDNLHNAGAAGSLSGALAYQPTGRDRVRVGFGGGRSVYDVPNTEEQEEANQAQEQHVASAFGDVSWQRVWSDRTVSHLTAYLRRGTSGLRGSPNDLPLSADADRRLTRSGGIASVTHQRGAHTLKAGLEAQAVKLDETFRFYVTDDDEAGEAGLSETARAFDENNPFHFADRRRPSLVSFYAQDAWQATDALSIGAGLRFDHSTWLLRRHQWSPRAGLSYRLGDATVLRGSVSRFFQPPQPEYLLLSSSAQARALSPFAADGDEGGGADLEPERQWSFEAGMERRFARWRVDAAYWRRWIREAADPNVFAGTTIIFPNAVARGRAQGFDLRVEAPRWRHWSGYASVSLAKVVQTGPITGGVFLEDEVGDIGAGDEFTPDHDQRAALASGLTWTLPASGLSLAATARYESGTPIQRDDDEAGELADRPGASLVDFGRGRVKPRTVVSLMGTVPLTAGGGLRVRVAVLNLFDRAYA
ncbi:MAG: TonB-dependent receptor, partial [Vicinamibacterales bacterium]